MRPEDFVLWLNGALGVCGDEPPSEKQLEMIRAKLAEVVGKMAAAKFLDEEKERKMPELDMAIEKLKQRIAMDRAMKHGSLYYAIAPTYTSSGTATAASATITISEPDFFK